LTCTIHITAWTSWEDKENIRRPPLFNCKSKSRSRHFINFVSENAKIKRLDSPTTIFNDQSIYVDYILSKAIALQQTIHIINWNETFVKRNTQCDFGEQDKLKLFSVELFVQFISKQNLLWLTWSPKQKLLSRFDFKMQRHLNILYKGHHLVTGFQT